MKYILLCALLFLHVSFVFADPASCTIWPNETRSAAEVLADCGTSTTGVDPNLNANTKEWFRDRIVTIASTIISFWALLAVWALVWAGIQYTKALGDDEHLKKAKTTGIYALIGLMLLIASFGLVDIFINFIYSIAGE